jgi:hypothetical protein
VTRVTLLTTGVLGTQMVPATFGAVGDGVTDDTAAFAAMLAVGGMKTFWVPPPSVAYLIKEPGLIVPSNTTIQHVGVVTYKLKAATGTAYATSTGVYNLQGGTSGIRILGTYFVDGSGLTLGSASPAGVAIFNSTDWEIGNVTASQFPGNFGAAAFSLPEVAVPGQAARGKFGKLRFIAGAASSSGCSAFQGGGTDITCDEAITDIGVAWRVELHGSTQIAKGLHCKVARHTGSVGSAVLYMAHDTTVVDGCHTDLVQCTGGADGCTWSTSETGSVQNATANGAVSGGGRGSGTDATGTYSYPGCGGKIKVTGCTQTACMQYQDGMEFQSPQIDDCTSVYGWQSPGPGAAVTNRKVKIVGGHTRNLGVGGIGFQGRQVAQAILLGHDIPGPQPTLAGYGQTQQMSAADALQSGTIGGWVSGGGGMAFTTDATHIHGSSNTAVKFTASGSAQTGLVHTATGLSAHPIPSGSTYVFLSYFVWTATGSNRQARILIQPYDSTGAGLSQLSAAITNLNNGDWTQIVAHVALPAGALSPLGFVSPFLAIQGANVVNGDTFWATDPWLSFTTGSPSQVFAVEADGGCTITGIGCDWSGNGQGRSKLITDTNGNGKVVEQATVA